MGGKVFPEFLAGEASAIGRTIVTAADAAAVRAAISVYSTAQVDALIPSLAGYATTAYVDSGLATKSDSGHSHAIADTTGLQAALDGKAAVATTISAGTGLSGGGDLSANRTLTLADTAVTPGSYTLASVTVDQQGRITAASNGAATAPGGSSGQFQYNNGGAFDGTTAVVYAGSGAHVVITAQASATIPVIVKGAASHSVALQEWQDNAGNVLADITPAGIVELRAAGGRFINYNHGTDVSPSYSWDISGNRGYGMSYGGGEIRFSVNSTRALSIGVSGISAVDSILGNTTKTSTGRIYGFKKQVWNNTVAAMTSGHYLGAVNTNSSLSSARTYTLPSAQAGDKYTFIDDNATYRMTIVPNSGDQIIWPDGTVISAATGSVVTTARYQTIELIAVNDTSWVVQKAIDLGTPFTVTP